MQLPKIQMSQTYLQLGLNIRKPVQEIEQPMAELNLRQEPAIIEIRQPQGVLSIDSTRARQSLGIRTPMEFSDYNASFGRDKLMEFIANTVAEGERLGAIEKGGNPIADMAFETFATATTPDIPPPTYDEGVDISFQARPAEINVERRGMKMDPQIHQPILKYTPGKVEGYVKQWNSLQLSVIGLNVDRSL
ncbi:DUF6470 family protein [Brevibacillus migulae]|uniref:DUF6470 family protein n=1 Tax=Brevibacillus migulae TaxID=1644114 RepID=UPI00106DF676|nr:DUF6470 family protein [Brevibacillus migulae]